jgi:signal transduction histidine kinase
MDSGIGIDDHDVERIFYPFFTTKETGTGLGLSIAYRIIEEHAGSISVKSSPGFGTTFEVILPKTNGKA